MTGKYRIFSRLGALLLALMLVVPTVYAADETAEAEAGAKAGAAAEASVEAETVEETAQEAETLEEPTEPDAPVLTGTRVAYNKLVLNWDHQENVDKYRVYEDQGETSHILGETTEESFVIQSDELRVRRDYTYMVEAIRMNGSEELTAFSNGCTLKVPFNTPTLGTVTEQSLTSALFTWTGVPGATGYEVLRRTDKSSWKSQGTTTGTQFLDTKVTPGYTYFYTVRAYRTYSDETIYSKYTTTGVTLRTEMSKTHAISAVAKGPDKIMVKWQKVANATGYAIYRRTDKTDWVKAGDRPATSAAFQDTGLKLGKKYTYCVRATFDVLGKTKVGENENTVSAITITAAPKMKSVVMNGKSVKLTWRRAKGASGYIVMRKTATSEWKTIATLKDSGARTYVDTKAAAGKLYRYTVRAYRDTSYGTVKGLYSTGIKKRVIPDPAKITSVQPKSRTSLELNWEQVKDADGYVLYRKGDDGKWKKVQTIPSAGRTHCVDTGLTYGESYTYYIRTYWVIKGKKQYGAISTKPYTEELSYSSKYVNGYKLYYDARGNLIKDVDGIIGKQSSYVVRVNKQRNCITVYAKDGSRGYVIPVKSMIGSCGEPTPLGTFYTPEKYRWWTLIGPVYGQWDTRIWRGILFHTVYYYNNGDNQSLSVAKFNILGTLDSMGCCRLQCKDAKWIYDNCPIGTKVVIYEDSYAGPLGRPTAPHLPSWHTWDPTDPNCIDLCTEHGCH